MKRIVLAALAAAMSTAAHAAGYDDFNRGLNANNRGDSDAAIAAFTAALAAPDMVPALRPTAYYGRGLARLRKKLCADAAADLEAAVAAKPDDPSALWARAAAYNCLGDGAKADADYDRLAVLAPSFGSLRSRGLNRWKNGDFSGAAGDFAAAQKYDSKQSYNVLWLRLTRLRLGAADDEEFASQVYGLSLRRWPGPVIDLFRGKLTPEQVQAAAAEDSRTLTLQGRKCEADFYGGEWLLLNAKADDARRALQSAADNCPHEYIEYEGALAELRRLGAKGQ